MRRFYMMALAGALTAPLPLMAQNNSEPTAHQCGATSLGLRGEAVDVELQAAADGKLIGATAIWDPPQFGELAPGDLTKPDIAMTIVFSGTTETTMGQPTEAIITVSVFAPLRKNVEPDKLTSRLMEYRAQYRLDGASWGPLAFVPETGAALPGTAERVARISLIRAAPKSIEVQLVDKRGKVAATMKFNLDGTAARDGLFRDAWAQAKLALADPKVCEPVQD